MYCQTSLDSWMYVYTKYSITGDTVWMKLLLYLLIKPSKQILQLNVQHLKLIYY